MNAENFAKPVVKCYIQAGLSVIILVKLIMPPSVLIARVTTSSLAKDMIVTSSMPGKLIEP